MTALTSDKHVREAVRQFLALAEERLVSLRQTPHLASQAMQEDGLISYNGVYFRTDQETVEALRTVCAKCHALVGADASNDQDAIDYLWRTAADLLRAESGVSIQGKAAEVVTGLEAHLSTEHTYINNNYVVLLKGGSSALTIGPVRAIRSAVLSAKMAEQMPNSGWVLTGDPPNKQTISLQPEMSEVCWEVRVRAAPGQVQARAEQLIALALSLLRFSLEEYPPLLPHVGEVETSSHSADKLEDTSVILRGTSPSIGGTSPLGYWVDYKITALTRSPDFKQRADHLFTPKKGALAARLAQGLIWQTRGRRSIDRTERLLFFFTAVEALLSRKGAPVAETIARFASVVLSEAPTGREKTYRRVKSLYEARSEVAHTGSHSVSDAQSISVQFLAEALYRRVLSVAPLDQPHADFIDSLSAATHGGPWPPAGASEAEG